MKDKKLIFGIALTFVFLASFGFSYAYFSNSIVNKDVKDQVVETDINGMLYFNIDWYHYYGNLSKGKYRIFKSAHNKKDNNCDLECKKYYYSIEFYTK